MAADPAANALALIVLPVQAPHARHWASAIEAELLRSPRRIPVSVAASLGPDDQEPLQLRLGSRRYVVFFDPLRPPDPQLAAWRRIVTAATLTGAAARAEAVVDTVKLVDKAGFVTATPPRAELQFLMAPIALSRELLPTVLYEPLTRAADVIDRLVQAGERVQPVDLAADSAAGATDRR